MTYVNDIDAPYLEIGEGLIDGYASYKIFGRNPEIDQNQGEVIVGPQEDNFYLPSDAQNLKIVSSDNQDSLTGTGLGQIFVIYLDENWDEQMGVFNLNGTTEVDTGVLCRRVNFARSYLAGTGATYSDVIPNGNIDFYHGASPANATLQRIPEGVGTTASASYTIPSGKFANIGTLRVQVEGGNNEASFWINIRRNDISPASPFQPIIKFPLVSELRGVYDVDVTYANNIKLSERTDFWVTGDADNQNNTIVTSSFFLIQSDILT